MAWITKPSATMQVAKRDEPYLTDSMRRELTETFLPRFETKHAALLPALHMIQHAYGWVPPQAMMEVGEFLELSPADVMDTATFYEEYDLAPRGKHKIAVCRSIACEFCGQQAITDAVREKLGIEVGETTDDDLFTLIELECIGACGGAPALLVDEELEEFSSPQSILKRIDELMAKG